ncbi:DUF4132 domain-containing protein [Streptomyces solicathayae]|uniref:DUF4132 domain-containing protein n=1 Tax=Streptomyces solicathayae TaxID=3081768 RepID=A0ABZ0LT73_9ACTN|nr:DUF4132 domain-containing protein [Streptomyces sp. HUAS YS2]WOX22545.1 DUF4132 domain-containing protein [Streptomyces sp. HUAS YS2]
MVGSTSLESRLDEAAAADAAADGGRIGTLLQSLDDAGRRAAALHLHRRMCTEPRRVVGRALAALAEQELAWTTAESDLLLARLLGRDSLVSPYELEQEFITLMSLALSAAERAEDFDRPRLRALHLAADGAWLSHSNEYAPLKRRVTALLAREPRIGPDGLPRHVLDGLDDYGPAMRAAHPELLAGRGTAAFLAHCLQVGQVRATKAWRGRAAELLAETEAGAELVRRLLEGIAAQPEHHISDLSPWGMNWFGIAADTNTCLVRGLLWAARDLDTDWAAPLIGEVAINAGTGMGGSGGSCRSQPLTTTAVAVLGEFDGPHGEQAIQALARVRTKVRNRTVLKGLAKAVEAVSARAGLTPSMLRERGVPDHGLDARGMREEPLGAYTAVLSAAAPGVAGLSFLGPRGKALKSAPKAVREEHAEALKPLRRALKELRTLLAGERARLEEHLAAGTTWAAADWQRYGIDHPITGSVARALLWEVRADAEDGERWTAGLPERTGGGWALAGPDGTATPVGPGARVRLWHPLRAGADEVAEWREELTAREVRQPFKQVFREVYPLTPAEATTGTYSNRFAGHVLRYGQARSLMTERGWTGNHLGHFGDNYAAEMLKELPRPGELPLSEGVFWRARFFVELVDAGTRGDGVAELCSTDQVRIERRAASAGPRGAWDTAPLTDVPALVLSEALRDVDLFTGVASIGAHPDWRDRGADRAYGTYWQTYAFGELTESAKLRKEALARLLPRTRVADRIELTDRFLRVRGDRRTYRIHLGSGNILMEPDDSYLCIVADRGTAARGDRLFLPFEEDGGLLSVILSKAFLLADDAKITDPTITAQLRRGL